MGAAISEELRDEIMKELGNAYSETLRGAI
jgi:hypothetical protein